MARAKNLPWVASFLVAAVLLLLLHLSLGSPRLAAQSPPPPEPDWSSIPLEVRRKIDPRILDELAGRAEPVSPLQAPGEPGKGPRRTRYVVYMAEQAELRVGEVSLRARDAQRQAVYQALTSTARRTQQDLLSYLEGQRQAGAVSAYQSFWIFNGIAVEGDLETLLAVAARDDVARVVAVRRVPLVRDTRRVPSGSGAQDELPWNIQRIRAPEVWRDLGITGEGVVVASLDTGVQWTHPALRDRYRGWDGTVARHDYHWFDPDGILRPDGLGPSRTREPSDPDDHGTHTTGTMVGDGGTPGTRIGVAPGARWIAVTANYLEVIGEYTDDIILHKAFQFLLAPTNLDGENPRPDLAPDVVNCSWGVGHGANSVFRQDLAALRAAGIVPVFAAGNPGDGLGSVGSPGALPEALAVGATDAADALAGFSGRGPSFWGEVKPELAAPGVDIFSTVPGGYEGGWSGTSMAAPHVAGVVALVRSASRHLSVDDVEAFLLATAADLGEPGPDNRFGWGRVDAYEATRWALSHGWLRGRVASSADGMPIAGAVVRGRRQGTGETFQATSDAEGGYRVAAPEGTYVVEVQAFGFAPRTFPAVEVVRGFSSLVDFHLPPLPREPLQGRVLAGGVPVAGATVRLVGTPLTTTTGTDGRYLFQVPEGTYDLEVRATGYRTARLRVVSGTAQDVHLEAIPRILLVEADAYLGWFVGWPVAPYFQRALDGLGYGYDLRVVTDVLQPPTSADLAEYDVVIWAHSYGSPAYMGLTSAVDAFLRAGGRLLLSGQDVAWRDGARSYFSDLLHAGLRQDDAAEASAAGQDILEGLHFTFEGPEANKRLPNAPVEFSPDELLVRSGAPVPILTYRRGGIAGLRVAGGPTSPYKAVLLGVGFESLGPLEAQQMLLERCLDWLTADVASWDMGVHPATTALAVQPGQVVSVPVRIGNAGTSADTYDVQAAGAWPAALLDWETGSPVASVGPLAPGEDKVLGLQLQPPAELPSGVVGPVTVTVSSRGAPALRRRAPVRGVTYPSWVSLPPLPEDVYRGGGAVLGGALYVVGGWADDGASARVYRYTSSAGQWERCADLPGPRTNLAVATDGQALYALGGITGSYPDYTYHQEVFRYDPAEDAWQHLTDLPRPLAGVLAAVWNGRLYAFGGSDEATELDTTYIYDLERGAWSQGAPMPGGARDYGAAVPLGSHIYVVGGWEARHDCERYLPEEDRWEACAPMRHGRQSPVATSDGRYLYVVGGGDAWTPQPEPERYNPSTDQWMPMPVPAVTERVGAAGGLLGAGIVVVGGSSESTEARAAEVLAVASSLAESPFAVVPSVAPLGARVTVTLTLWNPGADPFPEVRFWCPLPAGLTYVPGSATGGATYDPGTNQVQWTGQVGPGAQRPLSFQADVASVPAGEVITLTAFIQERPGVVHQRQATLRVPLARLGGSAKEASPSLVRAGDVLTYTIRVRNQGYAEADVDLDDPLPVHVDLVADSLPPGASYDAPAHAVRWSGTVAARTPDYPEYRWGDSDGDGDLSGVTYEWVELTAPVTVTLGDDDAVGPLAIGFPFRFYGQTYTELYIGSNGLISFGGGVTDYSNQYLPDEEPPNNLIAIQWDDLNPSARGAIAYQTMGQAPHRSLVVTFQDVPHYYDSYPQTFQVILYEGSDRIRLQYRSVPGDGDGNSATVGWENADGSKGFSYVFNGSGPGFPLHDGLAVLLEPPSEGQFGETSIPFQVRVREDTPCGTVLVNRAFLTEALGTAEALEAPVWVDLADLGGSQFWPLSAQGRAGAGLGFAIALRNSGNYTAAVTLLNLLPEQAAEAQAWTGGLAYDAAARTMRWEGTLPPAAEATLAYTVTLAPDVPEGERLTNVLTATTTCGLPAVLTATVPIHTAVLGSSRLLAEPALVAPGGRITYTVQVRNTGGAAAEPALATAVVPTDTHLLADTLLASTGQMDVGEDGRSLLWSGSVPPQGLATLRFAVRILPWAELPQVTQRVTLTDVLSGQEWTLQTTTSVGPEGTLPHILVPLVGKGWRP